MARNEDRARTNSSGGDRDSSKCHSQQEIPLEASNVLFKCEINSSSMKFRKAVYARLYKYTCLISKKEKKTSNQHERGEYKNLV